MLQEMTASFNLARMLLDSEESRSEAGKLVMKARAVITKAKEEMEEYGRP
jgi:hypothetical protein